jgi:hypothetical protein
MQLKKIFQMFVFMFAVVASSVGLTQPAKASDTVLLNNGLEWCQGCYDGWTVTSGATQWIAFVVTASDAAVISKVELNMNNTNAASLAGSTVSFYGNPTSAPKQSGDLLGTLTFSEFRLQPSQTTSGAAVFTGSVNIPSAGQYWFRFGDLSPTFSARYRFGNISNQTGPWSAYQGSPNMNFFDGTNQSLSNYYPAVRITGSAPALPSRVVITLNSGLKTAAFRTVNTISAVTTEAGEVTFFADGKKIARCISVQTNANTASCNWKPSVKKSQQLTAMLKTSGGQYSTISILEVAVVPRTTRR